MNENRMIRWEELQRLVGLSRRTIYRLEKAGHFPKRRMLGSNSIGWLLKDINEWLNSRPQGLEI